MKRAFVRLLGWLYRRIGTRVFFLFDSEPIHEFMLNAGHVMGRAPGLIPLVRALIPVRHPSLRTAIAGIEFENPIGLAAGFDHEGRLPRMIGVLGFGFESVGTVTLGAYEGNPYPRIKRLVKSRSMLVNKGFKSSGIDSVLARIGPKPFDVPIGISLGKTNTLAIGTHEEAVADIVESFRRTERSGIPFAYLELNISCPNLLKDISFYEPARLRELLEAVCGLRLSRPLFIKMPIILSDAQFAALLDVIRDFPVAAIIVGNLQKDKTVPAFDKAEIAEYGKYAGNWSGMPCQSRSDELVRLAYRHTKGALPVIGCGGVFTAEDAYRKIRLGASLVQMATAPVFMGPQIPAEICATLPALLARDGFSRVGDATGADARG